MSNNKCLNCGKTLSDKFCAGCGQKADTHRITFRHFIYHDVLHGTFHIEKGILFTMKQALLRPGKAALDYIAGKRVAYYNVFLLILLVIGVMLFLRHFYGEMLIEQGRGYVKDEVDLNEASKKMDAIFAQKGKIIILLFVPLAALNSLVLFKRKALNLSEHFILAGMILLGMLLLSLLGNLVFYFNLLFEFSEGTAIFISFTIIALTFIYIIFGYYNAFGNLYNIGGFFWRILTFFLIIFLELFIILIITIGFITNWKFGEVTISPFN